MIFRRWEGRPRWVGALALAMLVALLAGACGASSAATSHRGSDSPGTASTLSAQTAKNVAVQVWVRHLASLVALDGNTLAESESGFQLETDKLAIPVYVAEGQQENQYQPTGSVDWVSLPSSNPQLVILARIKTTWQPQPSSSVQQSSEDTLVLLERQDVGQKWRIVAYPSVDTSAATQLREVRQLKGVYPSQASRSLPVPPPSLPETYWRYVSGGADASFSPGPFTDQLRAGFQQDAKSSSQRGSSVSFPFEAGSQIGSYAVGGGRGDALVFFGVRYAVVQSAPTGGCIVQSSTERGLPAIVPDGRYASVRLEYQSINAAVEDKSAGTVTVLASYVVLVGASTTPTTLPACL